MTRHDGLVHAVRRLAQTRRLLGGALAIATLAGAARPQGGDILLNVYFHNSSVTKLRPDGSQVWTTTGGTGSLWEGCAITPQGHVVTTRRNPVNGVNVFDANGVQIATFDTPQVSFLSGDVSVFSDGTLVISDLDGGAVLYTEGGTYVTSFLPASSDHPLGNYVDASDNLWLCDTSIPRHLDKLSRTGVVLATILLPFTPGDMLVAPNGTLWVTSQLDGQLMHLAADGTVLGSIATSVAAEFCGVALALDGSFYVTGTHSSDIYHYSSAGALLNTIALGLAPDSIPLFLTMRGCGADPNGYCTAKVNSLGCLPAISSTGNPSASATSGFVVRGANVRNNKNGLLFYGINGRSSLPFQGGTLCVKTPLRRTGSTNSGGAPPPANDCSGVLSIDMNTFAHSSGPPLPLPALTVPGTTVDCQWWGRDQGFPAPNNTTLTDGLEYFVCP